MDTACSTQVKIRNAYNILTGTAEHMTWKTFA